MAKAKGVATFSKISLPRSILSPKLTILRMRSPQIGSIPSALRIPMPRSPTIGMKTHPMKFSMRMP